jgi:lipopolysaccharide export system permease protein
VIIDRYIIREISKPTVAISAALMGIFGCFITIRYLEESIQGQLPGSTVVLLVLLRIAIALEVLLPTTLYLSVIIAFGRLYRDSEVTSMFTSGMSMVRVMRPVFVVAVTSALIVACFSLYIRPWAWSQFYELKARAEANFDMTRMKGGNFYEIEDGKTVIFANAVDEGKNNSEKVFMQIEGADKLQIIYAQSANQYSENGTLEPTLVMQNMRLYEFPVNEDACDISQFGTAVMPLVSREVVPQEQRIKSVSVEALIQRLNPEKTAELQWRLMAPVSTLLLALLGVLLSRSSPREGKYAKVPLGILIFAVYYILSAITKKLVAQGAVGAIPGIWWTQVLLAGLLLVLLWRSSLLFYRPYR